MQPTTELQAVNIMLANAGEYEVNTLSGTIPPEATSAQRTLRNTSREVQKRGWYFNIEFLRLVPDVNGDIYLPSNTLAVTSARNSRSTQVTQRGNRLYNITPFQTGFLFRHPMELEVTLGLDFEDLPQPARSYITLRAARIFQIDTVGDSMSSNEDNTDETRAMVELEQEDARLRPANLGSAHSVASISRSAGHFPINGLRITR